MVRGKDSIRHHVRRKVRHRVMVIRPRAQIADSPRRLDWHKSHRGSLHGFGDCLGVGSVVLLALDIGLYELRRHQTDIVRRAAITSDRLSFRLRTVCPKSSVP